MLEQMEFHQFARWMEYNEISPIGEQRADLRMGQICAVVATVAAGMSGKRRKFKPSDFMFKFGEKSTGRRLSSTDALKTFVRARLEENTHGR